MLANRLTGTTEATATTATNNTNSPPGPATAPATATRAHPSTESSRHPDPPRSDGPLLASQCLQLGLVDEVLVYVLPVLLGDGVRFSTLGLGRIDLEPFSNTQSGPVTMLRFRVRRP
jgi:hypothetical protein